MVGGIMRRIVYLPPILLSDEHLAVVYRQRIAADPIHADVLVLFRERRNENAPLAFPMTMSREELRQWRRVMATWRER